MKGQLGRGTGGGLHRGHRVRDRRCRSQRRARRLVSVGRCQRSASRQKSSMHTDCKNIEPRCFARIHKGSSLIMGVQPGELHSEEFDVPVTLTSMMHMRNSDSTSHHMSNDSCLRACFHRYLPQIPTRDSELSSRPYISSACSYMPNEVSSYTFVERTLKVGRVARGPRRDSCRVPLT